MRDIFDTAACIIAVGFIAYTLTLAIAAALIAAVPL